MPPASRAGDADGARAASSTSGAHDGAVRYSEKLTVSWWMWLIVAFVGGTGFVAVAPISIAVGVVVAVVLVVVTVVQVVQRKGRTAIWLGLFAVAFLAWFASTDVVPADFTRMSPYVTTLLVLALASQRLRMPAADGLPYRKGSVG